VRKLKIYLDTSVISHLDQEDAPELVAETHKLWDRIKAGENEAVISSVVNVEIGNCNERKRNTLNEYLNEIQYTLVEVSERTVGIASRFVDLGFLREKSFDDCQHIAAAIISGCNAIVSWNFKHIVNQKTMKGVKIITAMEGYSDLLIYTPSSLMKGEQI
jgi:predicted nucleic acid-binding protein